MPSKKFAAELVEEDIYSVRHDTLFLARVLRLVA